MVWDLDFVIVLLGIASLLVLVVAALLPHDKGERVLHDLGKKWII